MKKFYLFFIFICMIVFNVYADTETPIETLTYTITPFNSYTITETQTETPYISMTETLTYTFTPAITPTHTVTLVLLSTDSPTDTITPTITETETETPFVSPTDSATNTQTITPTPTVTVTFAPAYSVPFFDDFSSDMGWEYGPEWERGYATASSGQFYGFPDPDFDHTDTSDNMLAGVIIGGNAGTQVHDFYYLTSPVIDTSGVSPLELRFWRHLNSDYYPFMESVVEVFDGVNWIRIYSNGGAGVNDSYWKEEVYDVTVYANPDFRVRFGHNVGSAGVYVISSWNIDDVYIGPPFPTPTITQTGTITQTWTISPTHSISPTFTDTFTISPTHSISPTFTTTPTWTRTPTPTITHTQISPYGIGMDWELVTTNPGFTPRQGHTGAVFNEKMWVIAGAGSSGISSNDVWSSSDGINWTQETASAGFLPRTAHTTVVFNNKLWVIGGVDHNSGMIYNDIWSSTDGINWIQETAAAPFLPRYLHTSVVYNNKIWVIAGSGGPSSGYLNDVWSSSDGMNWIQVSSYSAFIPRCGLTSAVINDRIYLFNGYDAFRKMLNDVWYSDDGLYWTNEMSDAPYADRMSNSMIFAKELVWVIGGYNFNFLNDVWVAPDGKYWTQLTASANFSPRTGFVLLYYLDKLWVIGGMEQTGQVKNDVWRSPPQYSTRTATPTIIPFEEEKELKIQDVLIFPHPFNPKKSDNLRINFYLTQYCNEVRIKIYTAAFRLIKSEVFISNTDAGRKQCLLDSQKLQDMSSGLYYFVLEAEKESKKARSKADYLVILK